MLTFNFTPFPVLQTNRLLLSQVTVDDIQEVFLLRSDPVVMKYIGKKPAEKLEEAAEFINIILSAEVENLSITWAISLKGGEKMIGTICLWNLQPENHRGEIGYVLMPEYHGQSIMSETIAAVLEYGFNVMNLHSIEGHVNPNNIGSAKVLEKNYFTREALLRENQHYNGVFYDTAIYTLFKRDREPLVK